MGRIVRASKQAGVLSSSGRAIRSRRFCSPSLVIPITTNLKRASLAGTAVIAASDDGLPEESVALAFQIRAIPKSALQSRVRSLSEEELAELELATDEAVGRVEPESDDLG